MKKIWNYSFIKYLRDFYSLKNLAYETKGGQEVYSSFVK